MPQGGTQKPVQQPEARPLATPPLCSLTELAVRFLVLHPLGPPGFRSCPQDTPGPEQRCTQRYTHTEVHTEVHTTSWTVPRLSSCPDNPWGKLRQV